jgi:ubiquinone/menaquinone biosynthesis C-methylase UbiE
MRHSEMDDGSRTVCQGDKVARELRRLQAVYQRRTVDTAVQRRNSLTNPGTLFNDAERRHALRLVIQAHFGGSLSGQDILDLGCGYGDVLSELRESGAELARCVGVDLMPDRVAAAQAHYPEARFIVASAHSLPFAEASFSLVTQSTLMTSILDPSLRRAIAREIDRVLRAGGKVLWYDYWINPFNRDARGISLQELRELFPGYAIEARRVTLAPPIARWLGSHAPRLLPLLNQIKLLRTHYLAVLTKHCISHS